MILLDRVTKTYNKNLGSALERVSLHIEPKEFVIVVGQSGAGKSTLLKLLTREERPTSGKIIVGGIDYDKLSDKNIPLLRRKIGTVFQDFKLLFDRTVFENVALALRVSGEKEEEISRKVENILELVSLKDRMDFFPSQLSGGELQRICLARAVVGEPEIIIADEPTGNLDLGTARQIVNLLKKINETGKTVIMATHNFEIVNLLNQRVIELNKGKIISDKEKGKYHLA